MCGGGNMRQAGVKDSVWCGAGNNMRQAGVKDSVWCGVESRPMSASSLLIYC